MLTFVRGMPYGAEMVKVNMSMTISPMLRVRVMEAAASEGRTVSNWAGRVFEAALERKSLLERSERAGEAFADSSR